MSKGVYGSANPRDLKSLSFAIGNLKPVKEQLCQLDGSSLLIELNDTIDPLEDVRDQIERAIDDDPPIVTKDGGVIRAGYDPEVDQLRDMVQHAKDYLAQMEAKEREETGIKNLRIGFNKIFGYSIEVTKSNLSQVPERYIRKQTLTNCERYITQELKELEEKLMGARESVILKEIQLFDQVRCAEHIVQQYHRALSRQLIQKLRRRKAAAQGGSTLLALRAEQPGAAAIQQ